MFTLVDWDSPQQLIFELALAVAIIVVIMWLARKANMQAPPPPRNSEAQSGSSAQSLDVPVSTGQPPVADVDIDRQQVRASDKEKCCDGGPSMA